MKALIGEILVFSADEKNNTTGNYQFETIEDNSIYKLSVIIDDAYLYFRLHYKWFMGLDIIIKQDNPSLFKKLKELIQSPLRADKFRTEFTVSQLKYLKKLLKLDFVDICFRKIDSNILREERMQLSSKSKR